jgi:hypothetical protein
MTSPKMNLQESSRAKCASEPHDIPLNPFFADVFWKILVKNLGEDKAIDQLRRMPEMLLQEFLKTRSTSEPHGVRLEALGFADKFWKLLVKKVGNGQAKHIMDIVMRNKKDGRPGDLALWGSIFRYIYLWGQHESDEKIARRFLESKPYYVECESGLFGIANVSTTEECLFWDETIVRRTPINKGLQAIKRQVGRIRRWLIEAEILSKEYAPRPYYRS